MDFYQRILDTLKHPVVAIDEHGKVIYANPQFHVLFQWELDEIAGKDIHAFIAPESSPEIIKGSFADFSKGGDCPFLDIHFDILALDKTGKKIPITLYLSKIQLDSSYIVVASIHDITRHKELEEQLDLKEEFLWVLLFSLPVGVIFVDPVTQTIHDLNLEAANMLGEAREQLFERKCFNFFNCKEGMCPVTDMKHEVTKEETLLTRADGSTIPVLKTVKPVRTGSRELLIEIFLDLTERKKLEEELRRLSMTDPLTGAYNRRYFLELAEKEMIRSHRTGSPFSLLVMDIDHFKRVNDTYGHIVGDMVLKKLVEVLKQRIRRSDTLARWGGEEFIVLLPDTALEGAAVLAEDLRAIIEETEFPHVKNITISLGVAEYEAGQTIDNTVTEADKALYKAKESGRNCVVIAGSVKVRP